MEGMELICFQIIAASGGAKSAFIAAIDAAKKGDFEEAARPVSYTHLRAHETDS